MSRHSHEPGTVANAWFSPDGSCVATTSNDCTVHLWDLRTGEALSAPLKHNFQIQTARFSPDSKQLLVTTSQYTPPGTHEGYVLVWDVATGKPLTGPLSEKTTVMDGWFSPDGSSVLLANNNGPATVWDVASGTKTATLTGSRRIRLVAFSNDGRLALTGGDLGLARVWETKTWRPLFREADHQARLSHIEFSPDGSRFLTAGFDGRVLVWDSKFGRLAAPPLHHGATVHRARFTPKGEDIVTCSDDLAVRVWRLRSPALLFAREIDGLGNGSCLSFSSEGRHLLTAGEDQPVSVWDWAAGTSVSWDSGPGLVHAVFDAQERRVLTTSTTGTARVWNASTGKPLTSPIEYQGSLGSGAFRADGKSLMLGSRPGISTDIWRIGAEPIKLRSFSVKGSFVSFAYSSSCDRLLTIDGTSTITMWSPSSEEPLWTLPMKQVVRQVRFSADGSHFVTTHEDGTALVRATEDGKPTSPLLRHGGPVGAAVFSSDGRLLATSSLDETARVWNAQTGEPLTPPLPHFLRTNPATFSPDGRQVVTADREGRVWFWDAATGESLGPPLPHGAWLDYVIFSPDGRKLATSAIDRVVRVWDLPHDDRPIDDLKLISRLLTASRFDDRGGLIRLSPHEIQDAWKTLHDRFPSEFGNSTVGDKVKP
jgi:WD40 repeat protein